MEILDKNRNQLMSKNLGRELECNGVYPYDHYCSKQDAADQFIDENIFYINRLERSDNTDKQYTRALKKFELYLNHKDYNIQLGIHDLAVFPRE